MSNKNLLDKMNLIDMDYVEAAVYPEANKGGAIKKRRAIKAAVVAAAIVALSVGCTSFYPQITEIAETFFNSEIVIGDTKVEGKMDDIQINKVSSEEWHKSYNTLDEVEELLGIDLLQSSKTYDSPVPKVNLTRWGDDDGMLVEIWNDSYYMYNEIIDISLDECGNISRRIGDGAYKISYKASFLTGGNNSGFGGEYEGTETVENYTTVNGLEATVFFSGLYGDYHAIIYRDNILYTIVLHCWDQPINEKIFKEYLDTIS